MGLCVCTIIFLLVGNSGVVAMERIDCANVQVEGCR